MNPHTPDNDITDTSSVALGILQLVVLVPMPYALYLGWTYDGNEYHDSFGRLMRTGFGNYIFFLLHVAEIGCLSFIALWYYQLYKKHKSDPLGLKK